MKKKTLITGANGFVGSNLTDYIRDKSNLEVFRVIRQSPDLLVKDLTYERVFDDKIEYENWIHLAGKAHDTDYNTSKDEFFRVNFELTKKIYNQFLSSTTSEIFIFISSIAAVAPNSETAIEESIDPKPYGYYGESKRAAEKYILENLPHENKKTVYIIRPPMIHGPGNKGNLNLLYNLIQKDIPWPLGAYNNLRSFLSIENFCFIILEFINNKPETGIYHVADDSPLSTLDLVDLIAVSSGRKAKIWYLPKFLIQIIARIGNSLPIPLNEDRLKKLTENYLVSNFKVKQALGINNMPVSAKDGMLKTLNHFNKV